MSDSLIIQNMGELGYFAGICLGMGLTTIIISLYQKWGEKMKSIEERFLLAVFILLLTIVSTLGAFLLSPYLAGWASSVLNDYFHPKPPYEISIVDMVQVFVALFVGWTVFFWDIIKKEEKK